MFDYPEIYSIIFGDRFFAILMFAKIGATIVNVPDADNLLSFFPRNPSKNTTDPYWKTMKIDNTYIAVPYNRTDCGFPYIVKIGKREFSFKGTRS